MVKSSTKIIVKRKKGQLLYQNYYKKDKKFYQNSCKKNVKKFHQNSYINVKSSTKTIL